MSTERKLTLAHDQVPSSRLASHTPQHLVPSSYHSQRRESHPPVPRGLPHHNFTSRRVSVKTIRRTHTRIQVEVRVRGHKPRVLPTTHLSSRKREVEDGRKDRGIRTRPSRNPARGRRRSRKSRQNPNDREEGHPRSDPKLIKRSLISASRRNSWESSEPKVGRGSFQDISFER